jgi:hypothetical protein
MVMEAGIKAGQLLAVRPCDSAHTAAALAALLLKLVKCCATTLLPHSAAQPSAHMLCAGIAQCICYSGLD